MTRVFTKEHRENLSKALSGRKLSKQHIKNAGEAKKGDKHHFWKGDNVSYRALHSWVVRNKTPPKMCIYCGKNETKTGRRLIHWANKSHKYKRDLDDWIALCTKCHGLHDRGKRRKLRSTSSSNKK
jgi:hypothetical protein